MKDSGLFPAILDSMAEAVYVRDLDKNIVYFNSSAASLFGWSLEEVSDRKCFEIFGDRSSLCCTQCPVDRVIGEGKPLKYGGGEITTREGAPLKVTVSISPLEREGLITGGLVVLSAEQEKKDDSGILPKMIVRSEQRLQLALEFTGDGLFDLDMETGEVYFSPGWKRILGYEDHEIDNTHSQWLRLAVPESVKKMNEEMNRIIAGERERLETEIRMRHKDGRWVDILARASVLNDGRGRAIRMVGTHTDISVRKRMERELEASRVELEEAQAIARLGSWHRKAGDDHSHGSREYFNLFGQPFRPEGFTREFFYGMVHPEDRGRVMKAMERALNGEDEYNETYRVILPDGRERIHNGRARIRYDGKGQPENIVGIQHDITEFTHIESALRQSEERYRSIIETSLDGFIRSDLKGKILETNPAYQEMSGYREEELLSMSLDDLVLERKSQSDLCLQDKICEKGSLRFETEHRTKDGGILELEVMTQFRVKDKQVVSFLRDVGERRRWERDLLFQSLLLDQIQDQIIATDLDGKIIYVNQAECRALGKSREELSGKTARIFGDLRPGSASREELVKATFEKGMWEGEVLRSLDGIREDILRCRTNLLRDKGGHPQYLVGIATDISEQKKIAEQLRQAQKLESIGSLAGGIAHDFNNLLTPVMGMAELLMEELPPKSPSHEKAQSIFEASVRGAKLVKQILAFSRKSAPRQVLVDLGAVIEEVSRLFRATVPKSISLSFHRDESYPPVMGDPIQINQVVLNLLTNAFHAMENRKGEIHVELIGVSLNREIMPLPSMKEGTYALVSIADTGQGMSVPVMGKIFEPYFTTKAQGKGTGLGLSVVYGIVKEHGGEITVESVEGEGSVFRIFLPASQE
ncbi:MAG: PAS domain S-box protein [Spirochaetales bacterium]|nr:PAS domain S-box protein [Spirochaetales bacterium]